MLQTNVTDAWSVQRHTGTASALERKERWMKPDEIRVVTSSVTAVSHLNCSVTARVIETDDDDLSASAASSKK
jgi:hypothetical protein